MNNANTAEEYFEAIIEAAKRNAAFVGLMWDNAIKFMNYDFPKIYADYAAQIGKDKLSDDEKKEAFLNFILEQNA